MKVAIIGAGICGLYLAKHLSEKGNEVFVFERRKEIGKESCSGLFSERILEFIPESKNLIQNKIDFVLIHFPKKTLTVKFSKKFFVMNHSSLDKLAAELAQKAGAKIMLGQQIESSVINFDKILGCDGALSHVRRILKLKDPDFRLGIQGFSAEEDFSNFVETWATKSGFIWKIPRGRETEYGIIEAPKEAKNIFDNFLKSKNLNLKRMNSAIIPQGLMIPKNKKITLCGDSAGLTKPWSGGGVVWGIILANLLLKNFPNFLKYQEEAKNFFLPKIFFSKFSAKTLYFLGFNFPWILPKKYKIDGDFI
ncbi:MAG: FAD-dependent monooxygenase [Candidatus Pacebacteria bacterium]|nr:FAD-dependent monooxygenase [Candidatus Paceibacterota bacterium]